jgi:O-methyltransferase
MSTKDHHEIGEPGVTMAGEASQRKAGPSQASAMPAAAAVQQRPEPRMSRVITSGVRKLVRRALASLDLKVVPSTSAAPFATDDLEFRALQAKCQPYTMTSVERLYALYQASKYVAQRQIPGAFVECGVWRGGSTMMMAHSLLACGIRDRDIYLYDTFEGMTEPTDKDVNYRGQPARDSWLKQQKLTHNEWCYASMDDVSKNIGLTGYPFDKFQLVQGKVEDTIPRRAPEQIALLRLDTDWFESTYRELTHLFPRLMVGGVLIIDDYGQWRGAREATDQYFEEIKTPVLLQRIDRTGRLVVKV